MSLYEENTQCYDVYDVGTRLELFVDGRMIDRLGDGATLRMHHPTAQEVALVCDRPWEGNGCNYMTVFPDGDLYRMYYRGMHAVYTQEGFEELTACTCYAESRDGISWERPDLGLFEVAGTKRNNVVLTSEVGGGATTNFCPFVDTRPGVPASERYKALGGTRREGLCAFSSADGIRWVKLVDQGVITQGAFDSQNLAFWDAERCEYRAYFRDFRDGRDIKTCTSQDFLNWTEPVWLEYTPGRIGELYTNQINPYYRAPHILLGFPTRYIDRGWTAAARALPQYEYRQIRAATSEREGTAVTDGMLMGGRDRRRFTVRPESFIRPGLRDRGNWFYGDNYQCLGLLETRSAVAGAPNELSFFASEFSLQGTAVHWRRFTIRVDGFVSVHAPLCGGEVVTGPIVFDGRELVLNYSTSAAGSVRVELQEAYGVPITGYTLADAEELYGDALEQPVLWKNGADVSSLAGRPVRLRMVLQDADIYSLRFRA